MEITCPPYYIIVEALPGKWKFLSSEITNPITNEAHLFKASELLRYAKLTKPEVMAQLFRINGGRLGYYLVNLKDKKYYYCGLLFESVSEKLLEIESTGGEEQK
ncbi:MAG: hypothetical protein HC916_18580 [Coleofasciculaceae cyanobacterium SM2_1_6]|nr:hypothetical protein [Coleofasciculaceae cyanobacterium SM2_1_6]